MPFLSLYLGIYPNLSASILDVRYPLTWQSSGSHSVRRSILPLSLMVDVLEMLSVSLLDVCGLLIWLGFLDALYQTYSHSVSILEGRGPLT